MKYIASCSFGKDSLAAIITRMEHGEPIDGAVYCRIMFDDETSAELPDHDEWIHTHAIPTLKARYGIETTVVQGARTPTQAPSTEYSRKESARARFTASRFCAARGAIRGSRFARWRHGEKRRESTHKSSA